MTMFVDRTKREDTVPTAMPRRSFLLGGAAGLGALALTGCGGSSSSSSSSKVAGTTPSGGGTKEISFINRWSDPVSQKGAQELFANFTKASGIKVKNQAQPNSGATYQPAVRNAFSSSSPPTMATDISGPEVFNLAKAGTLMDLTDLYNSTVKPAAQSGAIAGSVLDGKIYGISDGGHVGNLIWYNPDLLSKAGVDPASITTYSAWLAAMDAVKKAGEQPLVIGAKDQWPGGHYLNDLVQRALGSTGATALYNRSVVAGASGSPAWTDPSVVDALAAYVKLKPYFQKGFLGEAQATADSLFLSGKSAFYEMGSWLLNGVVSAQPKFEVGVMLFPALDGAQGKRSDVTIANDTIIVSKKADPAAVATFFEYFVKPDTLAAWASANSNFVPYTVDASKVNVDTSVKPLWGTINGYLADAGPDGSALFNDQAIDVNVYTKFIWQGSVGLMSGDVSPQELARQLEDATAAAQKKLGA